MLEPRTPRRAAAAFFHFEGCLNDCVVFVNGHFLARRFAAYSGFRVPVSQFFLRDKSDAACNTALALQGHHC